MEQSRIKPSLASPPKLLLAHTAQLLGAGAFLSLPPGHDHRERVGISPPPLTRLTKTQWHARVDRIHPPRFPVSINLCPISLHFLPPATPRPVPFALSLHIPVHRNTLKFVSEKLTGFRFREERRDASATEETRFKAVQEIYEDVMKTRAEQKEVPKRAKLECRRAESGLRNLDA